MIQSLLDICKAIPYPFQSIQSVYEIFLLDEGSDIEYCSFKKLLIVSIDHDNPIILLLLGHAEAVDDAVYNAGYL